MPSACKIFTRLITDITRDTHNALSRFELTSCMFMQTNTCVTADSATLHLLMNPSERRGSRLVLFECGIRTRASLIGDQAQIHVIDTAPKVLWGTSRHFASSLYQWQVQQATRTSLPSRPAVPPPHPSLVH